MRIQTKYNIGDKFWAMKNNIPQEIDVFRIDIVRSKIFKDKKEATYIKYNDVNYNGILEKDTFDTKQSLINYLKDV